MSLDHFSHCETSKDTANAGRRPNLLDSIICCILVYALKDSDRPFASSLLGVHVRNYDGEELHLSTQLSSTTSSENSAEKQTHLPICHPAFYAPLPQRTVAPPRARMSWLPPLKFQTISETAHPALQSRPTEPVPTCSQTNLLPAPPSNHSQAASTMSRPSVGRSQTTATAASSVYSRSTSATTISRNSSTLSSFSGDRREITFKSPPPETTPHMTRPDVPAIPDRYRHKSHSLRHSGRPLRPGSRPAMPPADFWMYARAAREKCNEPEQQEQPLAIYSESNRPMRPRAQSETLPKRVIRMSRYPVLPSSPEKAILRPNLSKGNMNSVGRKRSYESLRKGAKLPAGVDYGRLEGHAKSRDSRTLVKKRQPWDQEPRWERKRADS